MSTYLIVLNLVTGTDDGRGYNVAKFGPRRRASLDQSIPAISTDYGIVPPTIQIQLN
eukprot:SAG31_NODE_34454_length_332_cov_2.592275_1_plen_56_part_01